MKFVHYTIALLCLIVSTAYASPDSIEVTYATHEQVYINSGSDSGLTPGDTLEIYRHDSLQATIIIVNSASASSACQILDRPGEILAGDQVKPSNWIKPDTENKPEPEIKGRRSQQKDSENNLVNGYISFQNYWQHDMTGASLSYVQPGISSRIKIKRLYGHDLTLAFRHRSRLNHRESNLGSAFNANQWYHRVYQLSLSKDDDAAWHWGLGRQMISEVNGIGLVDGLILVRHLSRSFTLGFAGGFEPDRETTDISTDRKKIGLYFGWENKASSTHYFRFHLGLAGAYFKSEISREFLSLNSSYRYGQKISFFSSAQVDLNRSWRKENSGNSANLTNLYLNLNLRLADYLSIYSSYDRRENYWTYEIRDLADSLFDDNIREGIRVGCNLRISQDIRFNGNGGIRFREGQPDNNIYASSSLNINRFPTIGHNINIRFSYIQTEFTNGYRPSLLYRFPLSDKLRMTLTNTVYYYSGRSLSVVHYYVDLQGNYYISRRFYISASYRQHFSTDTRSGQLFFEVGTNL